jgi:hypothetical protein
MQWRVSPAGSDLLQFNNFLFENSHVHSKILSLFKPSTEVIRKGKAAKPNEFGKMVKLQEAERTRSWSTARSTPGVPTMRIC